MIPSNIEWDDIIKAIREIDSNGIPPGRESRRFLLISEGKRYPPKYVVSLANKFVNGEELDPSKFGGGQETVNFFRKLGFEVEYKKTNIKEVLAKKETFSKRLSANEQKNALQEVLQKVYGSIETEKKFEWLKTPNPEQLPTEYRKIVDALIKYRNQKTFLKPNYPLACDIVIEQHKIIIEYDENQHFSQARKITLENYPESIKTYFSKDYWIEQCKKINAKDNNPVDRDEKRAYYDAIRDIEAFKHGYRLIRIKHGDFDWTSENAIDHLKEIISSGQNQVNE